jgi:hypothetical protein
MVKAEKVPAGWVRVAEIARDNGWSRVHAARVARMAVQVGRAEMRNFRVMMDKRVLAVPHYRMKKK